MKVYLRNIIIMLLALSPFVAFSDYLQEAGEAYAGYDFAESERLAREGLKALRNKKSEPLYSQLTNIAEKAALGNRLLKHAQHILVIDSISVPAEEFLNHFRIPASAGKILTDDLLPAEFQEDFQMAFANENADFLILSPNPLSPSFQLCGDPRGA
ncbi:MAG: hypothetical protein K2N03_05400 [Muribaculaceae bacterium]|nr:hypothetical protein [Muribaculaceae bacterium]